MTRGPRPACQGRRVTNEGVKGGIRTITRARSEAEAELTCAHKALARPDFSGAALVVKIPFTPATTMPSVARVTRCSTVCGGHESVIRCDVMRQRKARWMVKAGQDSCSVHSLTLEASSYAELDHSSGPTYGFVASPEVGPGANVGTL